MTIKEKWVSLDELRAILADASFPSVSIDASDVGGLTPGSIPFADATGFLAQDNANLFWDETNARLGLNQTTPTARIDIVAEASFPGINIEAGASGEMSTPDGQQFRWGHWNAVDTFTERLKFDAAGIFYISYLTTGSVIFAGAGGEIKQDNADFRWDTANKRLGIGKVPANVLDVDGAGTVTGGTSYGGVVARFSTTDDKHISVSIDANTGKDPVLSFAEDGSCIWDIRNDALAPDEFQIRYQVAEVNLTYFAITASGDVQIPLGYLALMNNEELRFYDNGNYVGFEAPALGADQIWILPTADGPANEVWGTDGAGNIIWRTHDELAGFVLKEHRAWEDSIAQNIHNDNISEGSVTQHVGAVDHDALLNTHANPYKLDDLAVPDDNTDLDFSTALHGLVPKGTDVGNFLKDDGTWAAPAGGGDVTAAANITDHAIVRGNGGVKGVQDSGVIIDDVDNVTGMVTLTLPNEGLHLLDTGGDHDLIIKPGTDLGADRILTITTGDAARAITLSGNPTLDDWFDQAVKQASSPTFAGAILTGNLEIKTDTTYIEFEDSDADSDAWIGFQADDNFIFKFSAANKARYGYLGIVPYTVTLGNSYASGYLNLITGANMMFQVTASMASGNRFAFKPLHTGNDGMTAASGEQAFMYIQPAVTQSGTANYVGLLVDVTENTIGSGTNELLALRLATVDKFTVDNAGNVFVAGYIGVNHVTPRVRVQIGGDTPITPSVEGLQLRVNEAGVYIMAIENDDAAGWGLHIDCDSTSSGDPALLILGGSQELLRVECNGNTYVADHGGAATDMVINVCYGTGAAPAANTTTIGALYIKYTA